jgi:hypothetical protein
MLCLSDNESAVYDGAGMQSFHAPPLFNPMAGFAYASPTFMLVSGPTAGSTVVAQCVALTCLCFSSV